MTPHLPHFFCFTALPWFAARVWQGYGSVFIESERP